MGRAGRRRRCPFEWADCRYRIGFAASQKRRRWAGFPARARRRCTKPLQPADQLADFADDPAAIDPAAYETFSLRTSGTGFSESGSARLEDYTADQTTLRDHLRRQLHIAVAEPAHRLIGDHLIDLIDEAGYLKGGVR